MMHRLSPRGFLDLLRSYGIMNPEIHASPALCLGPCDITVGEMVSAYTAFVNHGIRTAPLYVTRIVDSEGNEVASFAPRMNEVISGESADKMLYMLRAVVDGGTAGRLRHRYNISAPLGGKTGTTNANSDGWFMGVAPKLVSGCWVGGDDRDIHFDSMTYGQGASMALPIFALYMKSLYNDPTLDYSQNDQFDLPADFDPCHRAGFDFDDMNEVTEQDTTDNKSDLEIIEELFE
jgi:penicillin-binding protein 1A